MEIAIVAKAKQGYIYRHMIENHLSANELARRVGLDPQRMGKIINFKWLPPKYRKGRRVVDKLEAYFKVPIEMLFPPELTKAIAARLNRKYIEFKEIETVSLECADQRFLSYDPQEANGFAEMADNLPKILCTLMPREETCLRLHYGIGGEGSERNNPVMDIPVPVRKLRNPSRRRLLRKVA